MLRYGATGVAARSGEAPPAEVVRLKGETLSDFMDHLLARVRTFRPQVKSAASLYPSVLLEDGGEARLAQSYERALDQHDQVVVMAMPFLAGAASPGDWLVQLVERARRVPGALDRTVFELQAYDWNAGQRVPTSTLVEQMRLLQRSGAISFGYYPDDFLGDHPRLSEVRTAISVETYPFPER
jgi:biofilm PGA synthesis lipoprotein PgaB